MLLNVLWHLISWVDVAWSYFANVAICLDNKSFVSSVCVITVLNTLEADAYSQNEQTRNI